MAGSSNLLQLVAIIGLLVVIFFFYRRSCTLLLWKIRLQRQIWGSWRPLWTNHPFSCSENIIIGQGAHWQWLMLPLLLILTFWIFEFNWQHLNFLTSVLLLLNLINTWLCLKLISSYAWEAIISILIFFAASYCWLAANSIEFFIFLNVLIGCSVK